MRFQNILLASLLGVGLGGAFTIPEGTEDGVYEHYIDSDGNDVHVKLANATNYDDVSLNAYANTPLPGRFKRAEDIPHCGAGNELPHGDTDAANADLDWQCDHYDPTPPRHNFYSIRGSVVAFFCNFDYINSHKCSSSSRQYTSGLITNKCGWYRPGWTNYAPHDSSYGYHWTGSFCGS